jgi:hypothetical protein
MILASIHGLLDNFANQVLPLQIFYGIGIVAAVLLLVQIAMLALGFDGHHDIDAAGGDGDIGFVSARGVVGFFVGFGWTGVIAFKAGWGVIGATAAAAVAGLVFMTALYLVARLLYAQQSSGNVRMENAIGKTGSVYLSLPGAGLPGGQVQIVFQGRMQTLPAITRAAEPIPSGSAVIVREIVPPDILLVEKL